MLLLTQTEHLLPEEAPMRYFQPMSLVRRGADQSVRHKVVDAEIVIDDDTPPSTPPNQPTSGATPAPRANESSATEEEDEESSEIKKDLSVYINDTNRMKRESGEE